MATPSDWRAAWTLAQLIVFVWYREIADASPASRSTGRMIASRRTA